MMQYFRYIIAVVITNAICAKTSSYCFPRNKSITSLNLANNNLLIIKKETFNKYQKLEELKIINSRVSFIADRAFYNLPQLKKLDLTRNFIPSLTSTMFKPQNKLWKLVVSHNLLTDIDAFNITHFPNLVVFDISNNMVKSIPFSLQEKIESDANFTFIGVNNPWDCGNWNRFCPCHVDFPKFQALRVPVQASFITCVFYTVAAFWIGIIVGNVCLIRKILFPRKKILKIDQGTQYG